MMLSAHNAIAVTVPRIPHFSASSHSTDTGLIHLPLQPLLDTTPAVRSLVWQYMDNRCAVQYLSTCTQLHSLYHSFPLTEAVSDAQFTSILSTRHDASKALHMQQHWKLWAAGNTTVLGVIIIALFVRQPAVRTGAGVAHFVVTCMYHYRQLMWFLFPRNISCSSEHRRLNRLRRYVGRASFECLGPIL